MSDKEIVEIAYGRAKVRLGAHGARFRVCSSWKAIRARMPETNSFLKERTVYYYGLIGILILAGCGDGVVNDAQLDALNPVQKKSYYASTRPELSASSFNRYHRHLSLEVETAKIMTESTFEVAKGGVIEVNEGQCGSLLLVSEHHARALKVCLDEDEIRIGTGAHVRYLKDQGILKYGLHVKNFLTEERAGIYSLSMVMRVN